MTRARRERAVIDPKWAVGPSGMEVADKETDLELLGPVVEDAVVVARAR